MVFIQGCFTCALILITGCSSSPWRAGFSESPTVLSESTAVIDLKSLQEKARKFDRKIDRSHLTPEGLLAFIIHRDSSDGQGATVPEFQDMAIWSGCYAAVQAFRYAVTGDSVARERLLRSIQGLHLLQEVTGQNGLLARGVRQDHPSRVRPGDEWHTGAGPYAKYRWLGDVSVDQVVGVFFGYAVAFDLVDDPVLRQSIAVHVRQIAEHLIENEMTIVDIDGRQTKHGDLTNSLFSEPLTSLIALNVFKTTFHITGDEFFQEFYLDLVRDRQYHQRAVRARDPWWEVMTGVNHSDNNLAFLSYYTLIQYEEDPGLLSYYLESLERAWGRTQNEGNPLFSFIYQTLQPVLDLEGARLTESMETLRLFPADWRDRPVVNSTRPGVCIAPRPDRFGRKQSCHPVPINLRPPDAFVWKENPYLLDRNGSGDREFSGVDYLLPYWMGRYHGLIPPVT